MFRFIRSFFLKILSGIPVYEDHKRKSRVFSVACFSRSSGVYLGARLLTPKSAWTSKILPLRSFVDKANTAGKRARTLAGRRVVTLPFYTCDR